MKLINEAKRFQELAGINEVKINFRDNRKALGTVFYENPDTEEAEEYGTPYVWNDNFIEQLAKDLGFEDYEDIASEFIDYTEPGSKEDIGSLENILGLKNLTIDKLTVEMYKQAMLRDFENQTS
jgi:hypothetical protein